MPWIESKQTPWASINPKTPNKDIYSILLVQKALRVFMLNAHSARQEIVPWEAAPDSQKLVASDMKIIRLEKPHLQTKHH